MYYSSSFVCCLVVVMNLYGIAFGREPVNSEYRMSYQNPQEEVVNIGNGIGRHNVIVLNQNPAGAGSYARPEADGLGNRFGTSPSIPSQPRNTNTYIGHGYPNTHSVNSARPQSNVPNNRNNDGISYVSPDGRDLLNVGYGQGNRNQVHVNTRPSQPAPSASSGGRTYHTGPSVNGGKTYQSQGSGNLNVIYVNGQPVTPNTNDGTWSTYYTNGQTIHILNSGSVQPASDSAKLKTLYSMSAEIEKFKSQVSHEAERHNIKL